MSESQGGFEYKATIDGTDYFGGDIISSQIERSLFGDAFSLGNVCSSLLRLAIKPKVGLTIGRMAEIALYYRRQTTPSAPWQPKGIYYIDNRKSVGNTLELTCYDKALMLEQRFLDEGAVPDFPMLISVAVSIICTRLNISLDARTVLSTAFVMEYPEAMTMREVLGYIGAMHGGNWVFTDQGQLRLVSMAKPVLATADIGFDCKRFVEYGRFSLSRITMFYNDTDYLTMGDDTGEELLINNPWATQEQLSHVYNLLNGYTTIGYSLEGAINYPHLELGDLVKVNDVEVQICTQHDVFGADYYSDMSFPMEQAIDHEYPYEGTYAKEIKQRVALGAVYEGVSISRKDGLVIAKSDGRYRVQMKSDLFVFQRYNDESDALEDSFYYDTSTGKFRIADNVIIDGSLSSDAVITDSLYAENGDVAELSVTTLQTYSKAWCYLAQDTSEVSYINIKGKYLQFIIAGVTKVGDVPQTEQLKNIYDEPLYWATAYTDVVVNRDGNGKLINAYPVDAEGKRVYTTTDETPYPVKTYIYGTSVKRQIGFEYNEEQNVDYPMDTFGAGSSLVDKEAGKGRLFKDINGFVMRYTTDSGEVVEVNLGNDGFVDAKHRQPTRFDFSALNTNNTFSVDLQGGKSEEYTIEKDAQGRITKINDTEVIW